MLGLFGTLNLGGRSLSVQQEATEVAGNNLANVNNPAYARQQLNMQSATSLQTAQGQEGTGIQAISITQIRNAILDNQIQAEGSVTGSLNTQQSALEDAQAYLGEQLSGSSSTSGAATSANGLIANISDLFSSFQGLSTTPGNTSQRQVVIQNAQQLAGQFNSVASGLATVRDNLNTSIGNDVTASNQDLQAIASLNQQIMQATAGGGSANDLIDLRQQKIEDLASKINITTTSQSSGAMNISIGGVTMVSGGTTPDSLQTFDAGGGQVLVRAQTAGTTLSLSGGSIEGAVGARDGALVTLQSSVNTLASQLITQVNSVYSSGYDLNGGTGANFFTGTDAASIGVNSAVISDPTKFQAAGKAGAAGDNSVVLALAQLGNQKISGLNNQTFSQSYASTVGNLGASLSSVNDQISQNSVVTQYMTNQRASISGVSTDEEMTNLVQFQKAYQASAELISTINQMLETVITMKTV